MMHAPCNLRGPRSRRDRAAGVMLLALICLGLFVAAPVGAELTIEIRQGRDDALPVAVVPFGWRGQGAAPTDIGSIVGFDLARSGQLKPLDVADMLSYPTRPEEMFYRDWRVQGIEYVVIGSVTPDADGLYRVDFHLFDVFRQGVMLSDSLRAHPTRIRDAAHAISDVVYERMTGLKGAYSTRLMYVLARDLGTSRARFRLEIADVDGARPRTLLESSEPLLSARWAPDGRSVVYASYDADGLAAIYRQPLEGGGRERLAAFRGLNSAPSFSPDGNRLAMVLSRDGNPEIYIMDLATRALTRVTRNRAIDTEPSWTPDGQSLIFTSNRGGAPQIYQVNLNDGLTDRLTFVGDYNARARMLPDGRHMIFVHRRDGLFHIALLDLTSDDLRVLTQTSLDESPSVAPNGTMLIYATRDQGQGILAAVSIDGSVQYRLPSSEGDVREPAWSPYLAVRPLTEPDS